jgi:hypothetical protein
MIMPDIADNALLTDFLAKVVDGRISSLSDVGNFVTEAAQNTSNLYKFGSGGNTDTVALYTGSLEVPRDSGNFVHTGNLAQDLSLRTTNVVALDTTPLGQFVKELAKMVSEPYADPTSALGRLTGASSAAGVETVFGTTVSKAFDITSEALIKFNKGKIVAFIGDGITNPPTLYLTV